MRYAICFPFLALILQSAPIAAASETERAREATLTSGEISLAEAVELRVEHERALLADLYQQLAETRDPKLGMELQKQVQKVKLQTEIDILQLQLERAEIRGQQELVQELKLAIEGLRNPPRAKALKQPLQRREG